MEKWQGGGGGVGSEPEGWRGTTEGHEEPWKHVVCFYSEGGREAGSHWRVLSRGEGDALIISEFLTRFILIFTGLSFSRCGS